MFNVPKCQIFIHLRLIFLLSYLEKFMKTRVNHHSGFKEVKSIHHL